MMKDFGFKLFSKEANQMSDNLPDYVCHLDCFQNEIIPKDPQTYNHVLITVSGGSRLTHEGLNCIGEVKIFIDKGSSATINSLSSQGDAELKVNHGSTLTFHNLTCRNSLINVMYSSNLIIDKFTAAENANCEINVSFASSMNIKSGYDLPRPDISEIQGLVDFTSTGICKATIEKDNVKVDHFSRWEV